MTLLCVGPFSPGTFGDYMSRDRFKFIGSILHFVDNQEITSDKFFKVQPLIDVFNSTFTSAFELGTHISFDEATIKATGKRVPGKMFNPMKPHKWGIKLFMTCCGETGYCYKFEVYKGKKDRNGDPTTLATGPAALIRNMKEFAHSKRIVYCDRFYTSIAAFIQLLFLGSCVCLYIYILMLFNIIGRVVCLWHYHGKQKRFQRFLKDEGQ